MRPVGPDLQASCLLSCSCLKTVHGVALDGARAQATVPILWPSDSVASSSHCLPRAGSTVANRPADKSLQKLAWLCPAAQAEPIHQLSHHLPAGSLLGSPCQPDWKHQMQVDRPGLWGRPWEKASMPQWWMMPTGAAFLGFLFCSAHLASFSTRAAVKPAARELSTFAERCWVWKTVILAQGLGRVQKINPCVFCFLDTKSHGVLWTPNPWNISELIKMQTRLC